MYMFCSSPLYHVCLLRLLLLLLQAEGIEKDKNQPVLISMQTNGTVREVRNITYPATGLVPDSQKIRVSVIGMFYFII